MQINSVYPNELAEREKDIGEMLQTACPQQSNLSFGIFTPGLVWFVPTQLEVTLLSDKMEQPW